MKNYGNDKHKIRPPLKFGFEIAKSPKGKNIECCHHREVAEKKKTNFFAKFQSLITRFRSKIMKNRKNGLEI